jgi:fluoride exporter
MMIKMFFIVGFGSFIGGGSRYLAQQFITKQFPSPFPYGTFIVNIVGCFIIGLIFALSEKADVISTEMRLLLATGFCGGFTTFSSFSLENFGLLRDGQYFHVFAYVGLSIFVGFLATYLGILLIKIF